MRFQPSRITTLALLISAVAQVALGEAPKPAQIHVYPADVHLTTVRDRQSVIVQAEFPDGITRDVTAEAKLTVSKDRKSTRLNSSHVVISYAVFCLKKKIHMTRQEVRTSVLQ